MRRLLAPLAVIAALAAALPARAVPTLTVENAIVADPDSGSATVLASGGAGLLRTTIQVSGNKYFIGETSSFATSGFFFLLAQTGSCSGTNGACRAAAQSVPVPTSALVTSRALLSDTYTNTADTPVTLTFSVPASLLVFSDAVFVAELSYDGVAVARFEFAQGSRTFDITLTPTAAIGVGQTVNWGLNLALLSRATIATLPEPFEAAFTTGVGIAQANFDQGVRIAATPAPADVPAPATLALLGAGLLSLARRRRRG